MFKSILLVLILALLPHAGAIAGDKGANAAEAAELQKLLKESIHGKCNIKGRGIEVAYDFKVATQKQDFRLLNPEDFAGQGPDNAPPRDIPWEAGKLSVGKNGILAVQLPLDTFQSFSIVLSGVDQIIVRWGTAAAGGQLMVGQMLGIFLSGEQFDVGQKSFPLAAKDRYRIEFAAQGRSCAVRIDGKKILDKELPKGWQMLGPIMFMGTGNSQMAVHGFELRGTLREDAGLIAANRGRGKRGEPPRWLTTFSADSEHYSAETDVSQEEADLWVRVLGGQTKAILAHFPKLAAADIPKRKIYVFKEAGLLHAYGEGLDSWRLPSNDYFLLQQGAADGAAADPRAPYLYAAADDLLKRFYPAAPAWWSMGLARYYAFANEEADKSVHFGRPNLIEANLARKYLNTPQGIPMSNILSGKKPDKYEAGFTAACWAWAHFLREGEGGANTGILSAVDEALRGGKEWSAAVEEILPVARFNALYPKFVAHLEAMK